MTRPTSSTPDAAAPGTPARIGAEIKRWREERGLSQAQLAARLGVNPSVMSRHESGQVPDPRASFLHRVADALEIPVWSLLNAAGPARGPDPRVLLRELSLMMHQHLPVALTRLPTPASTGTQCVRRASEAPPTFWVYAPQPGETGHSFCVVEISGDGFAPSVRDGDDAIVDLRAEQRLGDLVVVRGRGTIWLRRVAGLDAAGRPIVVDPAGVPETLGPHRVVVGVVVERRLRLVRDGTPLADLFPAADDAVPEQSPQPAEGHRTPDGRAGLLAMSV